MEACGLKQTQLYPCLFVGTKVMCICYVDDLIFWARDTADIDDVANMLINIGVDLEEEDDAAGFLGIRMEHDGVTGRLELRQIGLIDRILEALELDDGTAKGKWTPTETTDHTTSQRC